MSKITEIVRELRKYSTPAEKELWQKLRAHRFMGLKFKRQEPIIFEYDNKKHFFVADFLCLNNKMIIEVDGKIHDYQKEHDIIREDILVTLGYRVVRYKNEEILNNLNKVLIKLKKEIDDTPPKTLPKGKGK
jgi:very-short-patch-repair endonuclease